MYLGVLSVISVKHEGDFVCSIVRLFQSKITAGTQSRGQIRNCSFRGHQISGRASVRPIMSFSSHISSTANLIQDLYRPLDT